MIDEYTVSIKETKYEIVDSIKIDFNQYSYCSFHENYYLKKKKRTNK